MQGFPAPALCHYELHQAFSTRMALSQNKSFLPQVSSAGDFATVMCEATNTPTVYTLSTGSVPCGVSQGPSLVTVDTEHVAIRPLRYTEHIPAQDLSLSLW